MMLEILKRRNPSTIVHTKAVLYKNLKTKPVNLLNLYKLKVFIW
jgi:hypothetical protein